jgi:triphosphoribosyl-dephospho-CoA synthase
VRAAPSPRRKDPVAAAVLASCRMDVEALKPGNVSVYSEGHGMRAVDFFQSAELIVPVLAKPGLSVGERVWRSVEVTKARLGCNTNLGIILLCAPLVQAMFSPPSSKRLQERLTEVLEALDQQDAELAFRAIRLAGPAGLGQSEHHDVNSEPTVTLHEAMAAAQGWDRIAYQYAHHYEDIFALGVVRLREDMERMNKLQWATVGCYLSFLAVFPDSHIQRKFGREQAEEIRREAERVEKRFKACDNPYDTIPLLLQFDKQLKRGGVNPGTSADLTVASLLAFHLERLEGTLITIA